jgi:uncharacterized ferritin-like protein (DUF455 family)
MRAVEFFEIANVDVKLQSLESVCAEALSGMQSQKLHLVPTRSCDVRHHQQLAGKLSLNSVAGQARLLHDLANIELQATELAVRTLIEFNEAPLDFREQLAQIALEEGSHFKMCLEQLRHFGFEWGSWPVHQNLWQAVSADDSLLDRLLIVHCYLEGSGLDSGDALLLRLSGVEAKSVRQVVKKIVDEEVAHVQFGTHWYREICRLEHKNPQTEFSKMIVKLSQTTPKREALSIPLRKKAGFSDPELQVLNQARQANLRL